MNAKARPRRLAGRPGAQGWAGLYGKSTPADHGIELRHPDRLGEQRAPCPQCDRGPRDDALAVKIEPDGAAVWHCHRCGWKGSTAGRTVAGFAGFAKPHPVHTAHLVQEQDRARELLRRLWRESEPLDLRRHETARRYLEGRGLGALVDDPPADLRFHPALAYYDGPTRQVLGRFPALLAVVRGSDGRVMTLHRTYLDGAGKAAVPAPRKLCPPWRKNGLRGAAVRLYPATERLAVGEGIETVLAVRLAAGWPVWAGISAHGLASVEVPDTVREVLVCADFDRAGLDAAEGLAQRLRAQGRLVRVAVPDEPGQDFNDLLRAAA